MICGNCQHFCESELPRYDTKTASIRRGGACLYYDHREYHANACLMFALEMQGKENHNLIVAALSKNLHEREEVTTTTK